MQRFSSNTLSSFKITASQPLWRSSSSAASLLWLRQSSLKYFGKVQPREARPCHGCGRWQVGFALCNEIRSELMFFCISSWTNGIVRIWQYMCVMILCCTRICLFAFWHKELSGMHCWLLSKSRSRIAGEGVELKVVKKKGCSFFSGKK